MAEQILDLRPIPGWPGYLITSDGRVFSRWARGWHVADGPIHEPRELKPGTNRRGYRALVLCRGGRQITSQIHVLVMLTFVGPRPTSRHECRHLNGNPSDNRLENLAWGTASENQKDRVRHGTSNRGERSGSARLRTQDVLDIRAAFASGTAQKDLAQQYGVKLQHINHIINRKKWAWLTQEAA